MFGSEVGCDCVRTCGSIHSVSQIRVGDPEDKSSPGVELVRPRGTDQASNNNRVHIAAALLVAGYATWRAWATTRSWFISEDLVLLSDLARAEFSLRWLAENLNGEFTPLGRLLASTISWSGPFSWSFASVQLVLLTIIAAATCWWCICTASGVNSRALAPLVFYLAVAPSALTSLWWTVGVVNLLAHTFAFLTVGQFVRYSRDPRPVNLVLLQTAFFLAVFTSATNWLIVPTLMFITVAYLSLGSLRTRLEVLWRHWRPVWTGFVANAVFYLSVRLLATDSMGWDLATQPLTRLRELVVTNLATIVLGGPWSWMSAGPEATPRQLVDPTTALQSVSILAVALLLVFAYSTSPDVWKSVALTAVVVASHSAISLVDPSTSFGPGITLDPRIWLPVLPLLAIALTYGTAQPPPTVQTTSSQQRASAGASPLLVGSIVLVISSTWTNTHLVESWDEQHVTRDYLTTTIAELSASTDPVDIGNDPVPARVLPPLLAPYTSLAYLLAPLNEHFEPVEAGNDLHTLNGDGQVVLGIADPDIVISSGSDRECHSFGPGSRAVDLGLGQTTFDFPFWASIVYRSDSASTARVDAGTRTHNTSVLPGRHVLSLRTGGSFESIRLAVDSSARVCVERIHIGQVLMTQ